MAKQDLWVDNVKYHEEPAERNLFEHSRTSRRAGDNPCIGFKAITTRAEHYATLEGTLASGAQAEIRVDAARLHPEWKRMSQKRAEQFSHEMKSLVGVKITVVSECSYKPDYQKLREYF